MRRYRIGKTQGGVGRRRLQENGSEVEWCEQGAERLGNPLFIHRPLRAEDPQLQDAGISVALRETHSGVFVVTASKGRHGWLGWAFLTRCAAA